MTKLFLHRTIILLILFAQLLLSCGQNQQSNKTTSNESISSKGNQILIETFSVFPPEIDGCACYFSIDQTGFRNDKYIYADDYGNNAFVSINGVMTKFLLSKSDTLPGERSVETFINDKYEITIDVKQVGQLDETWQKTGTIKIKSKDGKEIIKNIYGECGC